MMLIGLTGQAGGGKDTVAAVLAQRGFVRIGFADPMKHFLAEVCGWSRDVLWGPSELRKWEDPVLKVTVRSALHSLGTAWGRGMVHEDVWVRYALRRVQQAGGDVVISDVRMPNEAAAIRKAGGKLVRVIRPGLESIQHVTEQHASTIEVNRVILNNGTLEALKDQAWALPDVLR